MKKILISVAALAMIAATAYPRSERVVILHTNDTHSHIAPDEKGRGGIVNRKAVIDSVRKAEPYVLTVDAGDAVQGTPYFTMFGGQLEQEMLNRLGYDVQILGNHEFDNGMEFLAKNYANAQPSVISSNNLFDGTVLQHLILPYVVKQVGDKRIGFIGININPEGLIEASRCEGVEYLDGVEAANRTAAFLRDNAQVDAIVAVSHIGYRIDPNSKGYTDPQLAAATRNIDLIIGGHSHTELMPGMPGTRVANLDGDSVLIVQNSGGGRFIGEVILTFDGDVKPEMSWKKLAVNNQSVNAEDRDVALMRYLEPYNETVDSLMAVNIGKLNGEFTDQAMLNFASDFVRERGKVLNHGKRPDLSIMNKGGVRGRFLGDSVSVGAVMTVFPFDNRIVLMEIKGSDLRELFDIMARQKGNGVSTNVDIAMKPDFSGCRSVTIDGKPLNDKKTYRIATIDYLVSGNDNMTPLMRGKVLATSKDLVYDDMIAAFRSGFLSHSPLEADYSRPMRPDGSGNFEMQNH